MAIYRGRRSSLNIKFADGDLYQYVMNSISISAQLSEANKWREQSAIWRDEAISASGRGDATYFDERDIFQQSLMTNVPIKQKQSRQILLRISLALVVAVLIIYCY